MKRPVDPPSTTTYGLAEEPASQARKLYDNDGNWIGIEECKEVSVTEAALIRSRLELQVYRTALEQIRDFPKQRGIPGDAGFAANSMVDIARNVLEVYDRRSTSEPRPQ